MIADWIDAIGKLGTLAVATAVFIVNRSQMKWTNRVAARTAEVENERFRLALVDKRLNLIDNICSLYEQLREGYSPEVATKLRNALITSEAVFENDQHGAIRKTLEELWSLREAHHMMPRCISIEQEEWAHKLVVAESTLQGMVEDLLTDLLDATKVRLIPPLDIPRLRLR